LPLRNLGGTLGFSDCPCIAREACLGFACQHANCRGFHRLRSLFDQIERHDRDYTIICQFLVTISAGVHERGLNEVQTLDISNQGKAAEE
jgi:hypothetical protein